MDSVPQSQDTHLNYPQQPSIKQTQFSLKFRINQENNLTEVEVKKEVPQSYPK